MEVVHIETTSKRYPLYLGEAVLTELSSVLAALKPAVSKVLIICDETVAGLFLEQVQESLQQEAHVHVVPSGEQEKSFANYYAAQTSALEAGLDRRSVIIAFGGGMVGDLAGFVAATYMRGIRFIQLPTTLLAHDSAVGGKVAINHPLGKNMIGAFHQPEAVLYHTPFLRTLPEKELRSGYAEMMKHALIWDADFYTWLRDQVRILSDLQGEVLQTALKRAIGVKAAVVAEDEHETGIRAYLNFGHTLGHALETACGYGKLTHGDAVAAGMRFAILLSETVYGKSLGYQELSDWFFSYGYPPCPALDAAELLQLMKKDKKAAGGTVHMVLMPEIGRVETMSVSDELIVQVLRQFQEQEGLR
ncbi:3-dehydroquinate synthase [Ectobacillus ponti]|uniref:3-dehydroquinate synthase n=1 Tax=Ectobacillus ponti TaxID=2961894 RepID=A0AA42BSS6_9BACI|nr:3-dehydroquinate synthase [Ectobacillus ponti]MCP8968758.1 3-dehydroquinate synthase [Ectobacillus ponti]